MKKGKGTRQWGKGQRGRVSRVKGSEGNGKGKGLRRGTERKGQRVREEQEQGQGRWAKGIDTWMP